MDQYSFDKFAVEGNAFVSRLASRLGYPENQNKAARVLKSVLRALRNRLSPEESMQFISQLPLFLKALYVDGWKIGARKERIRHVEEFLVDVRKENRQLFTEDFHNLSDVKEATSVVMGMLGEFISPGELKDIRTILPKEIGEFLEKAMTY